MSTNMDIVYEKSTPKFSGTLKDENGDAVSAAAIAAFTATLYDKDSGEVINSRTNVNLYGSGTWAAVSGMKATVDSSGNCTVRLASADSVLYNSGREGEIHVLLIQVTTTGSLPTTLIDEHEFYLKNLTKIT